MSNSIPGFYVTGGTLRADAPSYVERAADQDLFDGLTKGEFCYVLTARQMGKSSLMVRTAARLRAQGVAVAVIDLTMVGQNLSVEQWYDGLLSLMGPQLGLEDELERFWLANQRLGPLQRWMAALAQVVLPKAGAGDPIRPLVIFIDEIDTVRSLSFSSDEFFAAIRACYNRRTEDPAFERLTFCLLGVATPSDLIRDTRMTPFNIGRRIELNDFNAHEAAPLAQGLAEHPPLAERLLQRVLHWTNGHPYLTQRLCRAVAERGPASNPTDVDGMCAELFLSVHARERDDNLIFVRERLLNSEVDRATLLDLYSRIRRGKRVVADETNPMVSVTRLSGIARTAGGRLHVRNHIYQDVFDERWILSNMPDAEVRRQRAAFKRGAIGAVAAVVAAVGLLSLRVFKADKASPLELQAFEGQVELLRPGAPDTAPPAPPGTQRTATPGAPQTTGDVRQVADVTVPPISSAVAPPANLVPPVDLASKFVPAFTRTFTNGAVGSPMVRSSFLPIPSDPAVPRPTVRLTGVMNIFSRPQALFEIVPAPGQQPVTHVLEAGGRVGSVELVAIDTKNNRVTIKNNGRLTDLTLEHPSDAAGTEDAPVVLSIEGQVEIRRAGAQAWDPAGITHVLHGGDTLRTGSRSRAAVQLADKSILKISELSSVQIPAGPKRRSGFDLLRGVLYFFDRDQPAWEYQTVEKEIGVDDLPLQMQEWSREGWTVTAISGPIRREDGTIHRRANLRRPKSSPLDIKTTNATAVIRG